MRHLVALLLTGALALGCLPATSHADEPAAPAKTASSATPEAAADARISTTETAVRTEHSVSIGGRAIKYTATAVPPGGEQRQPARQDRPCVHRCDRCRLLATDGLGQYTGLSTSYIKEANLRIDPSRFRKELLRDRRRTVGRLDGRFEGIDADAAGEKPDSDAASDAATGAYNSAFNQYIEGTLHYTSDDAYLPNNYPVVGRAWDWKLKGQQAATSPYVGTDLATAMRQNPHLKVFSANGYYDLATRFYATEFDLGHLGLEPAIRKNIEFGFYQSGHMIYFDVDALKQVKADLARFYDEATPHS